MATTAKKENGKLAAEAEAEAAIVATANNTAAIAAALGSSKSPDLSSRIAALEAKAAAIESGLTPAEEKNWAIRGREWAENASYVGPVYVAAKEAGAIRGAVQLGMDAYKGIGWLLNK